MTIWKFGLVIPLRGGLVLRKMVFMYLFNYLFSIKFKIKIFKSYKTQKFQTQFIIATLPPETRPLISSTNLNDFQLNLTSIP